MSFFDSIKKSVSEMGASINAEIKKFRSKELLGAIVSGSAMIAFADGEVSAKEKQKFLSYIRNSEQLRHRQDHRDLHQNHAALRV